MLFRGLLLLTLLAPLALCAAQCNGARVRRDEGDEEATVTTEAAEPTTTESEAESTAAPETAAPTTDSATDSGSDAIFSGVARTELTTPMKWVKEAIETHNSYRELHGSVPLVFNKTLCDISQKWANYLAETGKQDHNPKRWELGENLYWSSNSIVMDLDAITPVKGWYDEINDYDYVKEDSRDGKKPVLHFTQVVWKETKEVGIAYATTPKPINDMYTTYVVANYFPRANWGDFKVNVVPPTGKGTDKLPTLKPTPAKPTSEPKPPTDSKPKDDETEEEASTGFHAQESLSLFLGCTAALYLFS